MFSILKEAYEVQALDQGYNQQSINLLLLDIKDKNVDIKSYKEWASSKRLYWIFPEILYGNKSREDIIKTIYESHKSTS